MVGGPAVALRRPGRVGDGGFPSSDPQTEWNRVSRLLGEEGNDTLHFNVATPLLKDPRFSVTAGTWGGRDVDTVTGNVPWMDQGVI